MSNVHYGTVWLMFRTVRYQTAELAAKV